MSNIHVTLIVWLLYIFAIFTDVQCQLEVDQIPSVSSTEDLTVTLNCTHKFKDYQFLAWYKHIPGLPLEICAYGVTNPTNIHPRYSMTIMDRSVLKFQLQIKNVQGDDAAVYYCAVRDGAARKLVFGGGTHLHIIPKTERTDPSVYKLKSSKQGEGLPNSVCLVTDFPNPQTNLKVDGIESSLNVTAVLDKSTNDVWRYSTVVWDNNNDVKCRVQYGDGLELPPISDPENAEETCSSLSTDASFRTNPSLNTLSQTVLGWRALTAKAIIFNLIITFRLWSS